MSSQTLALEATTSIDDSLHTEEKDHWQQMANLSLDLDFQSWLALQSGLIDSAFASVLIVRQSNNDFKPVAIWPEFNKAIERLTDLVEQVVTEGTGLVIELGQVESNGISVAQKHLFGVAYPISINEEIHAVIAIAVNLVSDTELPPIMKQLQWGASWIELSQMRNLFNDRQDDFKRLNTSIDLLAKVLPESGFDGASMRLITELAINLNCSLVSLGIMENKRIELAHLSHSADFGSHMNLVRAIEGAMHESLDQSGAIIYPPQPGSPTNLVVVAHKALADMQKNESLLSIPLHVGNEAMGAITLQRDIDQPFSLDDLRYCESVVTLATSALQEKRFNDRSIYKKIIHAWKEQLIRLFGPNYIGRKLILATFVLLISLAVMTDGDYRLSADASLKTVSQQVISSPFDGYIKDVNIRAGDMVKANDELLQLDNRDLLLERLKWLSQKNKLSRQYQKAIAAHDRARITVIDAQLAQAEAELNLVEGQLKRARITAPFDGLVVSGDLSQRLGGSVSHGEVLFELSPVDAYRVVLLVQENRIADLKKGQTGTLYLSALPDLSFELSINKITPVTEFKDSATFFVVEAILHGSYERLRPGMEGIGKITIDQRNLFSIWTRELREWLRLYLWRWWG
jgi:multidrug resistance efflux pump